MRRPRRRWAGLPPPPLPLLLPSATVSLLVLVVLALISMVRRCRLTLSPPLGGRAWFQRLKLQHDESLSNFALNFNLRRYIPVLLVVMVVVLAQA